MQRQTILKLQLVVLTLAKKFMVGEKYNCIRIYRVTNTYSELNRRG